MSPDKPAGTSLLCPSRVFFADAGGSHQADMSQETLLVSDFNKGDGGREE